MKNFQYEKLYIFVDNVRIPMAFMNPSEVVEVKKIRWRKKKKDTKKQEVASDVTEIDENVTEVANDVTEIDENVTEVASDVTEIDENVSEIVNELTEVIYEDFDEDKTEEVIVEVDDEND